MQRATQGRFLHQGSGTATFKAFLPADLPPAPPLEITPELLNAVSRADQMLGRLDGLSSILPNPDLLIYFYVRKEAVLSSQIEGTQSTLSELLLYEMEPSERHTEDVVEVSNYVAAMRHGLLRLTDGFPLSLRLLREMHGYLLRQGRGSDRTPGDFRTSQNWIGGSMPGNALYVPPPVFEMTQALGSFELFMNGPAGDLPILLQCALLHLQFESIHPFLDGNGRLGRLLITLLLVERKVLTEPLLYISLYLKQNKTRYYELLQSVRMNGDWEEWLLFFVNGVNLTAERAVISAKQILALFHQDEQKISSLRSRRGSAISVLQALQRFPYSSAKTISEQTGLALNTALSSLSGLERLGIVTEITGKERRKTYRYTEYLKLLDEGTELA